MNSIVKNALSVIGAPRNVIIRGKKVTPAIMFSPPLGESMLYWLSASISQKLHGQTLLNLDLVADSIAVSGIKVRRVEEKMTLLPDGTPNIGLASSLLIIGEAADQILSPVRSNRNYDYGDLFVAFRECVLSNYYDGEAIGHQDYDLNTLLDDKVFKVARTPYPEIKNIRG